VVGIGEEYTWNSNVKATSQYFYVFIEDTGTSFETYRVNFGGNRDV